MHCLSQVDKYYILKQHSSMLVVSEYNIATKTLESHWEHCARFLNNDLSQVASDLKVF